MRCGSRIACLIGGLWLGVTLGFTGSAQAGTLVYQFAFSVQSFSGTVDLQVDSQLDALGGHDIQSVSGVISGPVSGPITGLLGTAGQIFTDSAGQQWTFDNVLFTNGAPPLDFDGLLVKFGQSNTANLYSIGQQLYFSTDLPNQPVQLFQPGDPIQFQVAATPLPTTLPMFLAALIGFGS